MKRIRGTGRKGKKLVERTNIKTERKERRKEGRTEKRA